MEFFGVRLLGLNAITAHKLLLTVVFLLAVTAIGFLAGALLGRMTGSKRLDRVRFWTRQGGEPLHRGGH